jgi:outer membrane protein OmpA-like peptidoglycan-associated protein
MHRVTLAFALALLVLPALAQPAGAEQQEQEVLTQAQQALTAAEQTGAAVHAKTLYDDAAWRIRFAQENWKSTKAATRAQSRLRALEALWTARAAMAKARWIGTNAAARDLQADITRFGGHSDLQFPDEPPRTIDRGSASKDRIAYAQSLIDQAKAAGGEQVGAEDLKTGQLYLESARKIERGAGNNDNSDYLAYTAEMMARRAYYLTRANESSQHLPGLQLERTRLAQAASERAAAAEKEQREEAQRQALALQQQLAQEQANRQTQAAELERLRQQIADNRRAMQLRLETDSAARVEAERRVDETYTRYESLVNIGSTTETEAARRELEDRQIALHTAQERERLNAQTLGAELDRERAMLDSQRASLPAEALAERQADLLRRQAALDQTQRDIQENRAHRAELEQRRTAAVANAQRNREDAEAKAEVMRQQIAAATQAAQEATQQAQEATQQAQQTQAELEKVRQEQAERDAELARSREEQEKSRQEAATAQAELEKARQELALRDAEAKHMKLEQELARLAQTRGDSRGLIVTLPGIFFDSGKSALKAGAQSTLGKIAKQLSGEENVRISVEGHTDDVGSDDMNLALSKKRAEAVRDHLVKEGIPAERITATGKGETEPVATNKTTAGRQQNRRVELIITNEK